MSGGNTLWVENGDKFLFLFGATIFYFVTYPSIVAWKVRFKIDKINFFQVVSYCFLQFSCFHLEKNYQTKTTPAIFILLNVFYSIIPWEIKFGKKYSSSCSKRLAHSTNWRFKNLFNQLGAVWLAFKILCELYRCQCRLIFKYWDCVYPLQFIDKVDMTSSTMYVMPPSHKKLKR